MKISKRILGVAIALIMIFNVFAVGTFAAFPDDTLVYMGISTDKAVYAPGETITLTFSAKAHPELALLMIGGQYEIAYNNAVFEPYSTGDTPADHEITAIQGGYDAGMSGVIMPGNATEASPLYDWNDSIAYGICDDGATTFDATAGVDLFTVKFKVKADAADGTYVIGHNPNGYEQYGAFINDGIGLGGLYGPSAADLGFSVENTYEYGTCEIKVSSAPAVEVTHAGTQARYAYPGTPSAAAYQFGFLGNVAGLTPETVEENGHNVVTNIQSIVATAEYNGATVTSEVQTMWAEGDAYGFRAVFKGFDYLDTKDISVTFAITMADGTTEYVTADAAVDTANGIYTAAVGRGMPAIA